MRKLWILLAGILTAVIVAGCSSGDSDETDISNNYVPPKTILEDIENEETFAFVLVDETCSACADYKKGALKEMEEKNEGAIRYIELNGIENNEEDYMDIQTLIENELHGNFEATPTTYFIKDGSMSDLIVGSVSFDELNEKYEENESDDSSEDEENEDESEDEVE